MLPMLLPVEMSTPVRISSFMAANASRQNPRIPAVTITLDAECECHLSKQRTICRKCCTLPPGLLHQMATSGSVIMAVAALIDIEKLHQLDPAGLLAAYRPYPA